MLCPRCGSKETSRRRRRTTLGHRTLGGRIRRRIFHERSGTPFNNLQYLTDIALVAVLCRLRHILSFRDVSEMML